MSNVRIELIWDRLQQAVVANDPGRVRRLRGPADAGDLDALHALGLPLPEEFLASLRLHDGETDDDETGLLGNDARLLPAAEIVEQFALQRHLDSEVPDERVYDEFDDEVQRVAFGPVNPRRIAAFRVPVLSSPNHTWALDFAPGDGGTLGQVIRYSDQGVWVVCAPDYASFLQRLAAAIESGTVASTAACNTHDELEVATWPPLQECSGFDIGRIEAAGLNAMMRCGNAWLARHLVESLNLPVSDDERLRIDAHIARGHGDDRRALSLITPLLDRTPVVVDDVILAADLLEAASRNDAALALLSRALSHCSDAKLFVRRANWHRDQAGQFGDEAGVADSLKLLGGDEGQRHTRICIERAIADLDRAIALDDRPAWQLARADCLLEVTRWDEAEAAYTEVIHRLQSAGARADLQERAEYGLERARGREEGAAREAEELLASMKNALASMKEWSSAGNEQFDEITALHDSLEEIVEAGRDSDERQVGEPDLLDEQAHGIAQQLARQHMDTPERFAPYAAADIDKRTAKWLDRVQKELEASGFRTLATVEPVRNTEINGNRVPLRVLVASDGRSMAAGWRLAGPLMAYEVVDCESSLEDGRIVLTTSSGASNPFQPPPGIDQLALPLGTPPAAVYEAHRARLADAGVDATTIADLDDVLALQERIRLIKREHARRQGWISDVELRSLLGASYELLGERVRKHLREILDGSGASRG